LRSSDEIFMGYASHSGAFCVLNIDTNLVMENCEVTIDETQPCNLCVFECAGDDEVGNKIFALRMRRTKLETMMVMMVKLQPRMYPLLPLR
jgi:hypothetical protein